jgi:4-amino-4-deoxy-L-arabinose transferase-like glycosyltransferase
VSWAAIAELNQFRWHATVAAILLIASSLRFPDLQKVPLPLADEILAAVDVHYLMTTGHHFDGAHAGILAYVIPTLDGRFAVSLLGGSTVADFRLVAALFGVLTVGLMFWLGHELGDFRIGVLSAGALAVMPWHIYYSRIFFPGSEYVFVTTLAICLEMAALRKSSVVLGIGSAVAAGASVYIYPVGIVSTPLLMGCVLAFHWHEVRNFGWLKVVAAAAVCGGVVMLPYAFEHIAATDPSVATANSVISSKLIWNNGLDVVGVVRQFISNWASYLTPSYILLHGDRNVEQSIQQMGEVGWALGGIGFLGILVGAYRRTSTNVFLIALTAIYPIADALTYFDAPGNSLRGLTGSVIWALWVAVGARELLRIRGTLYRTVLIVGAAIAVAIQSFSFITYYFGQYTIQYAYAFEIGYDTIYPTLVHTGLQAVPITLHAGYEREAMLEYFSQYRLHATQAVLACNGLPPNVVNYTEHPRIFIVREDRGFAAYPQCIQQTELIEQDRTALLNATPRASAGPLRLEVIAVFPNDPQGDYYTAIWYLHW